MLLVECQITMMKLENCSSATIGYNSGKNFQQMLKLVGGNFDEEQDICLESRYLLHKRKIVTWWRKLVGSTLT